MKRRDRRARWPVVLMVAVVAVAASGCVERTLIVRSEPDGADVYIGGERVGVTPLEHPFHVYGTVDVELRKYDEHGGYRAVHLEKKLKIPWHQHFPLDFFTEFLIPWPIHDVHHVDVTLEPETRTFDGVETELEEKVEEARRTLARSTRDSDPPPAAAPNARPTNDAAEGTEPR